MTVLGDLVTLQGGGTPPRDEPRYWNGAIPWASVKDLGVSRLVSTVECISPAGVEASATRIIKAGHVVVATRMAVGRASILEVDAAINQDLKALIPRPGRRVHPNYLLHLLGARTAFLEKRATGATVKGIRSEVLENLPVPHTNYDEQRRIADILDKADAIRRKRKEAIALTEELLRSTFLEMFGDPVTNSKGWPVRPLGELVDIRGGGTPSRARADYFEGTIPWATAKDFQSDFMSETQEHVSDEAVAGSATQLVPVGTVLVVVKSKILMRRLPVAITRVPLCFNQDVKGLVAYDPSESVYIAAHLRLAQRKLLDLARGANTEGLTVAHLRSHLVMRPPAGRIRDFTAFETIVRSALEKERDGLGRAEDLFNGLIAGAFRGELRVAEAAC